MTNPVFSFQKSLFSSSFLKIPFANGRLQVIIFLSALKDIMSTSLPCSLRKDTATFCLSQALPTQCRLALYSVCSPGWPSTLVSKCWQHRCHHHAQLCSHTDLGSFLWCICLTAPAAFTILVAFSNFIIMHLDEVFQKLCYTEFFGSLGLGFSSTRKPFSQFFLASCFYLPILTSRTLNTSMLEPVVFPSGS